MKEITTFSLESQSDTESRLRFNKRKCDINISGVTLEKQYRLDNGFFLIFTTDDCPYEECLHITLLNENHQLVYYLDLGLAYNSAIFDNAKVISNDMLEFDFYSNMKYRLFINTNGARFNLQKPLPEVSYYQSIFSKRYLRVDRVKSKENKNGK